MTTRARIGNSPIIIGFIFWLSSLGHVGFGQDTKAFITAYHFDSLDGLELVNSKAEIVSYRGRHAVRLLPSPSVHGGDEGVMAVLIGPTFKDGIIEADVAGLPR